MLRLPVTWRVLWSTPGQKHIHLKRILPRVFEMFWLNFPAKLFLYKCGRGSVAIPRIPVLPIESLQLVDNVCTLMGCIRGIMALNHINVAADSLALRSMECVSNHSQIALHTYLKRRKWFANFGDRNGLPAAVCHSCVPSLGLHNF